MCPASVWSAFVRLSPCRRILLIEGKRIEAEYETAKTTYDRACEISQTILDTWGRVESMQTQEIRLLLAQELGVISQKACGLIHQTIMKALAGCGLSLKNMDVGHGGPGAARDREVSLLQYPSRAQKLSEWLDHAVWVCPAGE